VINRREIAVYVAFQDKRLSVILPPEPPHLFLQLFVRVSRPAPFQAGERASDKRLRHVAVDVIVADQMLDDLVFKPRHLRDPPFRDIDLFVFERLRRESLPDKRVFEREKAIFAIIFVIRLILLPMLSADLLAPRRFEFLVSVNHVSYVAGNTCDSGIDTSY